jgi:hypothetical protein
MSSDAVRPPPSRRRSRTVRAVALVTVGLGAAGCEEPPPPDLPGQTQARIDACRVAHLRLGEDPARCDLLETTIAREHAEVRPRFTTIAACETLFGSGACEGETLAATGPGWRPVLAGWSPAQGSTRDMSPVVRDRAQQYWSLSEPVPAADRVGALPAPRPVAAPAVPAAGARPPPGISFAYYRLAPIYPDEQTCAADWERCERFDQPLPNRFATREGCVATWGRCIEVEVADALPVAAAAAVAGASASPTSSGSGGSRSSWWVSYNSGWRDSYGTGVGPRYQGWTWTANRQPTPAYRPAAGTGPLRAWDGGSNRLGVASRMAGSPGGGTTSRFSGTTTSSPSASGPGSSVSRAGFGSTGSSYSSGG